MDLNIQRVFASGEAQVSELLKTAEQPVKDGVASILATLKSTATNVLNLVEPHLAGDVQTLETGAETLLNAFIESKVKGAAGTVAATVVDGYVDSAAETLITFVQKWAASSKSGQ